MNICIPNLIVWKRYFMFTVTIWRYILKFKGAALNSCATVGPELSSTLIWFAERLFNQNNRHFPFHVLRCWHDIYDTLMRLQDPTLSLMDSYGSLASTRISCFIMIQTEGRFPMQNCNPKPQCFRFSGSPPFYDDEPLTSYMLADRKPQVTAIPHHL